MCLNCARGVSRVVVDVIPADHEFSIVPAVGSALPIHIGASGKALVAFLPAEEIDRIVRECDSHRESEYAVVDIEELHRKLRYTRRNGFAWSIGDVFPGSAAVSAPVFDETGDVAGSLTVRGPSVRLNRHRLLELAPTVKRTADELSASLGHRSLGRAGIRRLKSFERQSAWKRWRRVRAAASPRRRSPDRSAFSRRRAHGFPRQRQDHSPRPAFSCGIRRPRTRR